MKLDRRRSIRQHTAQLLLLALAAIASPGCVAFQGIGNYLVYNDPCNDFVLGYRNTVWAQQAWRARKHLYCDQPQYYAFAEGFRAGYEAVAGGGNGCVPAIPPRKFWSWKYQTAEGQAKVAAWYAGYPYGAKAAQEDGAGLWQDIQVSHLIEMEYSPEFERGECPPQQECYDCYEAYPGAMGGEVIDEQPIQSLPEPAPDDLLPIRPDFNTETRYPPMGPQVGLHEAAQRWPTAEFAYVLPGGAQ